ncbi:MAG: hypothetical protein IJZ04_08985 [Clostridia bacterium]|nr:hypothetical protein [Clostridia bacterium]
MKRRDFAQGAKSQPSFFYKIFVFVVVALKMCLFLFCAIATAPIFCASCTKMIAPPPVFVQNVLTNAGVYDII